MPIATSNGRRLNYELQGNGDAVLMFASSLGTSLELWDRQTESLLLDMAAHCGLEARRDAMLRGDPINSTEQRAVRRN